MSYSITIFISAFLLFQVQPIVARYILPWFGGASAVWTTCLVYFQISLLLGYTYAHVVSTGLSLKKQAYVHLFLCIISLTFLPIEPQAPAATANHSNVFSIITILFHSIGIPFIILSASGPLLQHWYTHQFSSKIPWRLYAYSNIGSLLALLSYPFIIEPNLTLKHQTIVWATLYSILIIGITYCAKDFFTGRIAKTNESNTTFDRTTALPIQTRLTWLVLAAVASAILLATTNYMCQDIAAIPFLWILPLSLYLITFIICFERDQWYQRIIWIPMLFISIGIILYVLQGEINTSLTLSLGQQIAAYAAFVFLGCMVCHGELVRRKPAHQDLTKFYLYVALGGALGGISINLIAPLVLDGYWEFHISIILTIMVLIVCFLSETKKTHLFWKSSVSLTLIAALAVTTHTLFKHIDTTKDKAIFNSRSFYGVMRVFEKDGGTKSHYRSLYHGRIRHGEQWLDEKLKTKASSYFGKFSGVGYAISKHPIRTEKKPIKVGIIGLGIGTLATYRKPEDTFIFYEIDPEVKTIANTYFTYLHDSNLTDSIVIGDGRIQLERELNTQGPHNFDVLVVDAFSGNAIPSHLLTIEASELYWQHLKKDGILAMHISNRYIDLLDIVRQLSLQANKELLYIKGYEGNYTSQSRWVLITENQTFLANRRVTRHAKELPPTPKSIIWTDDYSNLSEVVRW